MKSLSDSVLGYNIIMKNPVNITKMIAGSGLSPYLVKYQSGTLVLMYHSIRETSNKPHYPFITSPTKFERHLQLLNEIGEFVGPDEMITQPDSRSEEGIQVLLTFDDGYKDNLNIVHPLLQQYDANAVVFVATNHMESPIDTFLDWDTLRILSEKDEITIGSHGKNHINLTSLRNSDVQREVRQSKKIIEEKIDNQVKYFSYPYGECTQDIRSHVKKAGYDAAFIDNPLKNDTYMIGRLGISCKNDSINQLQASILTALVNI